MSQTKNAEGCLSLLVVAAILWFGTTFFYSPSQPRTSSRSVKSTPRPVRVRTGGVVRTREDLSNTLAGRLLVYSKHIEFLKQVMVGMGKRCKRNTSVSRWDRWSAPIAARMKSMFFVAKGLAKRWSSVSGIDTGYNGFLAKLPRAYSAIALAWGECNKKVRGQPHQETAASLTVMRDVLPVIHAYGKLTSQYAASPPPTACKSIAEDLQFLDIMYSVVTRRTYKPTLNNCGKVVSRVRDYFSEKWLTRYAPKEYAEGEDPVATGRRVLGTKSVRIVMRFDCKAKKELRKKYGRRKVRGFQERYLATKKGLKTLCRLP